MVNANIDIFETSYEEFFYHFRYLESLEKIKHNNSPNPASLPVDSKKRVSAVG
jgi:hypothetical protein